eukprot:TRINITY_DN11254_c0_g1_i3.p1 TRINITY_DN11254_c0_g1~~TRINITY_DN11254_c0_g1_i3.p1  ORF type:complete len:382 (+),score=53.41 TRINITY_DN11254_c0_g1_i3:58-1146(+)
MAGVLDGSTHTLESHLNEFYTPEHKVDGLPDDEEESVAGSDIAAWPDPPANDVSVAGIVSLASKDGERDPTLGFTEDGADGLALDQALTSLRPKVLKLLFEYLLDNIVILLFFAMAGVLDGSTHTLESHLNEFYTPEHKVDGLPDDEEESVAGSDIAAWPDPPANDVSVAGIVSLASKDGERDPTLGFTEDGADGLALDQALTSLRPKVNKMPKFAASKSGATHQERGLPQDWDGGLALDQTSTSLRPKANKMPRFAASKFGATYPEQGQPEDGDNALDQSWSLRRSSVNKIAVSKSGAAPSAWELPQDGDDSLTLDQSFSSRQSNVSKIPLKQDAEICGVQVWCYTSRTGTASGLGRRPCS